MNKYEPGNPSEGIALCAYLEAGFAVSVPFAAGASYDLIVDSGSRLIKAQVKTAWISNGCVIYNSERRQPGAGLPRRPYKKGEVDFFAAYCPSNPTLYAVHGENHGNEGRLRFVAPKNGQAKFARWARDFTWERHIGMLKNRCAWHDSNVRPPAPEAGALSTELQARGADSRT